MSKNFKDFINEAEEKAPAPAKAPEPEKTADSPEIALDPRLEKEVYIDSFEVQGKNVVIKSLGLGPTKPVVVYVDDKRWEVFPGPRIAKREARRYVKKMATKLENLDVDFEKLLAESNIYNKREVSKWLQKNKRKFDNSTEAAFAVADEFGMEDELEDEKHWIWDTLKKMYKESFDLDLFVDKLLDGTKIKIDEKAAKNVKLVYDLLDESNKTKFREAFIINKENHNKVMKFVEEQTKGI
tara:strand:- start:69 stop:788 length:720 start_codon:yes stop_codon:yes gene_type:complete